MSTIDSRTNEQTITEIQQGIDVTANLQHLYEKNLPLIKMLCKKYQMGLPLDDCLQEAYIALWDAVRLYNPEKSKFSNYLGYWIRHKLVRLQYQSKPIRLPAYLEQQIYQYDQFVHDYEKEHGTLPQVEEICEGTGFSVTDVANIQKAKSINVVSLDAPQSAEDDDMFLYEAVADENADVEQSALDTVMNDALNREIRELTPNQQRAIVLVFCRGMRYRQVAQIMGISTSRVAQLVEKGLKKLRRTIANEYFADMERAEAYVYSGGLTYWERTHNTVEETIVCKHEDALEELIAKIRNKIHAEQGEM